MAYRKGIVEEIKTRIDIYELVEEHSPNIRPMGSEDRRQYKSACPLCRDKGSLFVDCGKQIFTCFRCGAGGDIFAFLMALERIAFVEALQRLGKRTNVRLEE